MREERVNRTFLRCFAVALTGGDRVSPLRWVQNADLYCQARLWVLSATLLSGVLIVLTVWLLYHVALNDRDTMVTMAVGLFGILVNFTLNRYQALSSQANCRVGTMDTFLSDILSICAVVYSLRLPERYTALYRDPDAELPGPLTPGEADYLHIFREHGDDLRYLGASRDAARQLLGWNETSVAGRQHMIVEVMIELGLCLTKARSVAEQLACDEKLVDFHLINEMLVLCYRFYDEVDLDAAALKPLGLIDRRKEARLCL